MHIRQKAGVIFVVSVLLLAVSCQEKPQTLLEDGLSLPKQAVPAAASNQFVHIQASGDWILRLSEDDMEEGEEIAWIWLKSSVTSEEKSTALSGKGSSVPLLQWEKNNGASPRACYLELETGGKTFRVDFRQEALQSQEGLNADNFKSDPIPDWLELPAVVTDNTHYYVSHRMTGANKGTRNYSFLLDTDAKIAVWMAYPLNDALVGPNTGRTNAWGLDPKVPQEYQSVLYSSYKGYDRGHQVPSADRYGGNNESTFYGTNMTPQLGSLNQKAWARLESKVRTWSSSFDTLYVVTGADIAGSTKTVSDNFAYYPYSGKSYSKEITVPVGYFKVLLGYKKSGTIADTGQNGGYTAIGFYFEHRAYDNTDAAIMSQSMSVDELEAKLGYDFFPNLSSKTSSANAVESKVHSWWK